MQLTVTPDTQDEQLVRDFQAGDEEAFSRFTQRHQDRVYRLARMWLWDTTYASDVVQETFMRSYTGLSRFRFRASPQTWLLRVCKNVCREHNRQNRHLSATDDAIESFETVQGPEFLEISEQRVAMLRNAVDKLPDRQREVVVLRMLEDLSTRDTARVMGCRPGTVKASLHKALIALRGHIDGI